jgi:serine/threonine protein kinase
MELRVARKFRIGNKVGSGSFGEIYAGENIHTREKVAIKLEPIRSRHPQLLFEAKIYRTLQGGGSVNSIPQIPHSIFDFIFVSLFLMASLCETNNVDFYSAFQMESHQSNGMVQQGITMYL